MTSYWQNETSDVTGISTAVKKTQEMNGRNPTTIYLTLVSSP